MGAVMTDMLFTMLTGGSRGDTQPYIALGLELMKAGHRVRIAASEGFASFVTGHGLEFHAMSGDVQQLAKSAVAKEAMKADNPLKFARSFNNKTLKAFMLNAQQEFYEASTGSDAIIYHPGVPIGFFIAQHLNIPSILATPFPMTPTREYPAMLFYDGPRLGGGYNLLTHRLFESGFWMAFGASVREFWQKEFGHLPANFSNPYRQQHTRRLPTITSCSDYVFARPADWPEHAYNTGFWFLDEEAGWQPSAQLLDLLQAGPPPVYVGFGSLGDEETAGETTALAIDALKRSGQRGILASGWSGMTDTGSLPENVFMLQSAPHAWLFPRMAAVVHHGGAGTTAAGLRAGVPGIVIPHANDQFAWGRRVYELGVGAKSIPKKKLTAENLAAAIQFALRQDIRAAARELGAKIQTENGVGAAAKIILGCSTSS